MGTDRVGVAALDLLVLILRFGLVRLWVWVVLEPGRRLMKVDRVMLWGSFEVRASRLKAAGAALSS